MVSAPPATPPLLPPITSPPLRSPTPKGQWAPPMRLAPDESVHSYASPSSSEGEGEEEEERTDRSAQPAGWLLQELLTGTCASESGGGRRASGSVRGSTRRSSIADSSISGDVDCVEAKVAALLFGSNEDKGGVTGCPLQEPDSSPSSRPPSMTRGGGKTRQTELADFMDSSAKPSQPSAALSPGKVLAKANGGSKDKYISKVGGSRSGAAVVATVELPTGSAQCPNEHAAYTCLPAVPLT
jgi:hypothetical protein